MQREKEEMKKEKRLDEGMKNREKNRKSEIKNERRLDEEMKDSERRLFINEDSWD